MTAFEGGHFFALAGCPSGVAGMRDRAQPRSLED